MNEEIKAATKRAFHSALASGRPITWRMARRLGVLWCAKMWPKFDSHPWIEWRGSRQFLTASAIRGAA
jgi:hypothetical protein